MATTAKARPSLLASIGHPSTRRMVAAKTTDRVSSRRVVMLGTVLVAVATIGFYTIPGMIDAKANGSHLVNSIYCAVMTLTT